MPIHNECVYALHSLTHWLYIDGCVVFAAYTRNIDKYMYIYSTHTIEPCNVMS